ncbi:MAG: type II toxin-antitoxin system prevent-host-death family antitoxin [Sphingomonadaceae bacterium]|nr:type II toxin-antitoxin system prevent-host-death family antitoxin [Sphingomonadaceae bacterium]
MEVTSTEFQNRTGLYIEQAAKAPVFITKHRRPQRVLLDVAEYERLRLLATHRPTREAFRVEDLPQEVIDALENVDLSHIDPELDKLMD